MSDAITQQYIENSLYNGELWAAMEYLGGKVVELSRNEWQQLAEAA